MGSTSSILSAFDVTGLSAPINAGMEQAKEARIQAGIVQNEANERADDMKSENEKFQAEQELSFLKAGVILDGSPLMVLNESARKGAEDVANVRRSGYSKADALRRGGRRALLGGITQGIQTGIGRGMSLMSMGAGAGGAKGTKGTKASAPNRSMKSFGSGTGQQLSTGY